MLAIRKAKYPWPVPISNILALFFQCSERLLRIIACVNISVMFYFLEIACGLFSYGFLELVKSPRSTDLNASTSMWLLINFDFTIASTN